MSDQPIRVCGPNNWDGVVDNDPDAKPSAIRWATRQNRFNDPVWSRWHYTEGNSLFSACGRPVVLFKVDGSPEVNDCLTRVNCHHCLAKMRRFGTSTGHPE